MIGIYELIVIAAMLFLGLIIPAAIIVAVVLSRRAKKDSES
jgi:hypothetical protein